MPGIQAVFFFLFFSPSPPPPRPLHLPSTTSSAARQMLTLRGARLRALPLIHPKRCTAPRTDADGRQRRAAPDVSAPGQSARSRLCPTPQILHQILTPNSQQFFCLCFSVLFSAELMERLVPSISTHSRTRVHARKQCRYDGTVG